MPDNPENVVPKPDDLLQKLTSQTPWRSPEQAMGALRAIGQLQRVWPSTQNETIRVLAPDATPEQAMPSASLKAQQEWKSAQDDAVQKLRDGASWLTPEQATGLLQRMVVHESSNPDAGPEWQSAKNEFISAFRDRSRGQPFQHLAGFIEELKTVPGDKQTKSDEFDELKKTINGLPASEARTFLSTYNFGPNPDLDADAMRQLKEGLQNRAGVRVSGSLGEPQELKDAGDIGVKNKFERSDARGNGNKLDHKDLSGIDAYNAMASPLSAPYGDARKTYERTSYTNVSRLQVNTTQDTKSGSVTVTREGYTRLSEIGIRSYIGTGSSIDPSKIANANQSFIIGGQAQSNLIHSNYGVKYEPKAVTLAGKEIKVKQEISVDAFIGATGDVRAALSLGPYATIQIQGAVFSGARAEVQSKTKFKVAGHDLIELKGKAFASAGAEGVGTISFGNVYDSIEGKVVTTGLEVGGMAFAGARAGAEIGGDLGGVGLKLKAEGWAGVG